MVTTCFEASENIQKSLSLTFFEQSGMCCAQYHCSMDTKCIRNKRCYRKWHLSKKCEHDLNFNPTLETWEVYWTCLMVRHLIGYQFKQVCPNDLYQNHQFLLAFIITRPDNLVSYAKNFLQMRKGGYILVKMRGGGNPNRRCCLKKEFKRCFALIRYGFCSNNAFLLYMSYIFDGYFPFNFF